jgi:hypothetical protein
MNDKLKVKVVELKLDGKIHECSYRGNSEDCFGGASNSIFRAVNSDLYFRPCKKHLPIYLEALKTRWNETWRKFE